MTIQEEQAAHPRNVQRPERVRPSMVDIEAAEQDALNAAAELDALMLRAHELKTEVRASREAVARCYRAWMNSTPRTTHEDIARQNIADGVEQRRAKANGEAPPPPKPRVYLNPLDCVGLHDNSAEGHARKTIRGYGHRRGFVGGQPVFDASKRGGQVVEVFDANGVSQGKRLVGPQ